jgi:hypothetical protein
VERLTLKRRVEPVQPTHVAMGGLGNVAPRGKIAQFGRDIEICRRLRLAHVLPLRRRSSNTGVLLSASLWNAPARDLTCD